MRKLSVFALPCLSALILAACGPGAEDPPPEPTAASPEAYVVRGEVLGVYPDDDPPTLTLHHETIDGFMDSMTMPFVVDDQVSLAEVAEGDKVQFTLTVDAAADEPVLITAVEKLPADTALEFPQEQPPAP